MGWGKETKKKGLSNGHLPIMRIIGISGDFIDNARIDDCRGYYYTDLFCVRILLCT